MIYTVYLCGSALSMPRRAHPLEKSFTVWYDNDRVALFLPESAFRTAVQAGKGRAIFQMFNVYLMRNAENEIRRAFPSAERTAELAACRDGALRESKCASWTLLDGAILHATGAPVDFRTFTREKNGKWSCPSAAFSLSHTKDFCAAVVSDAPCGIDIEERTAFLRTHDDERAAKIKERILAAGDDANEDFLTLWTKKESLYKAYGSGGFAPREIDTGAHTVRVYTIPAFDLTLSVCGENLDEIRFFCLRENKVVPMDGGEILPTAKKNIQP